LDVPVIAAGGIFHGEDIVKALKAGASGVQMASRFVATYECDASDAFKQAYINAKEEDIVIMDSPVGLPGRALINPMLNMVNRGEKVPVRKCYNCVHKCDPKTTPFCITEALINAAIGDLDNSLLFVGSRVFEIDHIQSVQEIITELVDEVNCL
jgi:NAD(P)H-dependent flavin oxidoreductase YrpB (nitropropane dioxygenase family)